MVANQPDLFAALANPNAAPNAAIPHAKKGLRHCGIWGSARSANPQSAAQCRSQPPSKRNAAKGDAERVGELRENLKDIASIRATLVGHVDQYLSSLKAHREALSESYSRFPAFGADADVKEARRRHYAALLKVSEDHGPQYREYLRLGQMAKAIERDIDTLNTKGKS